MQKRKVAAWKVLALSTVVLTGGAVFGTGLLAAQTAKQFAPRAYVAMMASGAQKELGLSDAQKLKVKTILQSAVPRGIALHDNMKLAPEDKRERLEQLQSQTKNEIGKVLTTSQRAKFSHLEKYAQSRVKQTMEHIANELKLSSSQREKIRPIVMDGFSQGKALRGDMTLTVAQKFVRLQAIRKTMLARVDEVLTAKQRAQLDVIGTQMQSEARRQFGLWREQNAKS